MPKIMKSLNNISRCQAAYRNEKLKIKGLTACHCSFILLISRNSGLSQEEIAREICLNKSTVARTLAHLEELGYITRTSNPQDKRQILVFPTEKILEITPKVRSVSKEWNSLISEDISEKEMDIFYSVLQRIEDKAKLVVKSVTEN